MTLIFGCTTLAFGLSIAPRLQHGIPHGLDVVQHWALASMGVVEFAPDRAAIRAAG